MSTTPPIQLEDGLLRFTIHNRETGESAKHFADVFELRLTFQECEVLHNLQTDGGVYLPTTAFFADARTRIGTMGLPNCSLKESDCNTSILRQLWGASLGAVYDLQKKTNETPNSPSGSESNQQPSGEPSAESNSPPPTSPPSTNDSESGAT